MMTGQNYMVTCSYFMIFYYYIYMYRTKLYEHISIQAYHFTTINFRDLVLYILLSTCFFCKLDHNKLQFIHNSSWHQPGILTHASTSSSLVPVPRWNCALILCFSSFAPWIRLGNSPPLWPPRTPIAPISTTRGSTLASTWCPHSLTTSLWRTNPTFLFMFRFPGVTTFIVSLSLNLTPTLEYTHPQRMKMKMMFLCVYETFSYVFLTCGH